MSETAIIEETIESLPENGIKVTGTAAYVVFTLAIYGAQDLTRKAVAKTNKFRANRKAKKAAEKAQSDTPQA